jgi:hypothetical protein
MGEYDAINLETVLERVRIQATREEIRITQHAQQEMTEDNVTLEEVLYAITTAQIIENYPEHKRGPCCLLNGITKKNRPLHIVCTTALPTLIIITVYEPKPPKWVSPTQRRQGK